MDKEQIIYVGMPATNYVGSDRYPYEVIEISDGGNLITVREMDAISADGYDYYCNQVYTYRSCPQGRTIVLSKRKDGKYRPVGMSLRNTSSFYFGVASYYQDPHFWLRMILERK